MFCGVVDMLMMISVTTEVCTCFYLILRLLPNVARVYREWPDQSVPGKLTKRPSAY